MFCKWKVYTERRRASIFEMLAAAIGFLIASAVPVNAQGMTSAGASREDVSALEVTGLGETRPGEISTIQRLLRRLDYLADENLSGVMDAATISALLAHLRDAKLAPEGLTGKTILSSLFAAVWLKEGWASGHVKGQQLIVEPAAVRGAQEALKKLGYMPDPPDGVFGPATLSAVEIFQEDNGMKVTGLLTANTAQNIVRAVKFIGNDPAGVVRVLDWPNYIDPGVLDKFERETNIRVLHEAFDNSAETKDLLLRESPKYDVMVQAGAQAGLVFEHKNAAERLDRSKLPFLRYLDPAALRYTGAADPDNSHSVPYVWGSVGLGVNAENVKRIRPDAPLNSLALVLDPAVAADVSKCGIAVIDEPADVMPAFVAYAGGDASAIGITDLEAVEETLSKVAQYFKVVSMESYIDGLATGKYCVVFGYSGGIFVARDKADEKKTGTISYSVPTEGGQLWFSFLVMPGKARNKEGAYKLINYLMKPEVAGANTNFIQYANPIPASALFIEPRLLVNPGIHPPRSVLERLTVLPPLTANVEVEFNRIWSKLSKE
jgi:putrescine transport system substrate-binding protein